MTTLLLRRAGYLAIGTLIGTVTGLIIVGVTNPDNEDASMIVGLSALGGCILGGEGIIVDIVVNSHTRVPPKKDIVSEVPPKKDIVSEIEVVKRPRRVSFSENIEQVRIIPERNLVERLAKIKTTMDSLAGIPPKRVPFTGRRTHLDDVEWNVNPKFLEGIPEKYLDSTHY